MQEKKSNAILYGVLAGLGLLVFYISIISIFQGFYFAILNLRSLWYLVLPLAAGFGIQIGIYSSIRHSAMMNAQVAASGGMSGGAMIACCSHFLLNIIPIAGFSGLATVLAGYQKGFLGLGLIANVIGIIMLANHKRKMKGRLEKKLN